MADSVTVPMKPKRLRLTAPTGRGRLLTKRGLITMMKELANQMQVRLEVDGAAWGEETGSGAALRIQPGGETIDHPWKGTSVGGAFSVLGGFVNSIEVSTEAVAGGSGYAYLELSFVLDVADNFVFGGSLSSASIEFGSSVPGDDESTGNYRLILFEYASGRVVAQSATQHIRVQVCDAGRGDGSGFLNVIQS